MVESRRGKLIEPTPMTLPVEAYLDRLEGLIDPVHQQAVEARQRKSFRFEPVDHVPVMVTLRDDVSHQTFGTTDWPTFYWHEQMRDYDKMLLNELAPAYESALLSDDKCFTIRPNLGQGFIPSIFGCQIALSDAKLDSLPWVVRDEGYFNKAAIARMIEAGVPELSSELLRRYEEIVAAWRARLADYPKLSRFAHITLPDLQGPFNLAFHLRGVELYTDVVDDPPFVHGLLGLMADAFTAVGTWCKRLIGEPMDEGFYWNWRLCGGVRNVDDNSIMLGPEYYADFVLPYNDRAFAPFGGGAHHSCGELAHLYPYLFEIERIRAMHFGNPELQDFGTVWPLLEEKRICLLWDQALAREHRARVKTGIIVREICRSLEDARGRLEEYRKNW